MSDNYLTQQMQRLDAFLSAGEHQAAMSLCHQVSPSARHSLPVQLALSRAWQRLGEFDLMLSAAKLASSVEPAHAGARLRVAECLIYCAQSDVAVAELAALEQRSDDPDLLQEIAQMYLHCARHADAARCHERAVQLRPGDGHHLFNLASSCVALGDHRRAEALFDAVIKLDGMDAGARLNKSMLRSATLENNSIADMQALLARLSGNDKAQVPLCYALAKEYEDVGDHQRSFALLERGAGARRAMLAYRVENDVAAIAAIAATFDATRMAGAPAPRAQEPSTFVIGLPRSGTTLVERILASHSEVGSLGEVNNFAFAVMKLAAGPGNKLKLIERSAEISFEKLGAIYRDGITGLCSRRRVVNKLPENYLYLGLIRLALPGARIIHLRRHPLDSCYAMYKTLFRMGYPFSYSLEDLGRYYLAYHGLIEHWRTVMPGAFLDIDYEELVRSQEATSRRMVDFCGLSWEDGCLDFHRNASPSATASAAQVRRPVYQSSVQRWRAYSKQLAPLAQYLTAHGIDCT
ncbi:MAG: sulfotransferase [Pseudomonadota bacterium]